MWIIIRIGAQISGWNIKREESLVYIPVDDTIPATISVFIHKPIKTAKSHWVDAEEKGAGQFTYLMMKKIKTGINVLFVNRSHWWYLIPEKLHYKIYMVCQKLTISHFSELICGVDKRHFWNSSILWFSRAPNWNVYFKSVF